MPKDYLNKINKDASGYLERIDDIEQASARDIKQAIAKSKAELDEHIANETLEDNAQIIIAKTIQKVMEEQLKILKKLAASAKLTDELLEEFERLSSIINNIRSLEDESLVINNSQELYEKINTELTMAQAETLAKQDNLDFLAHTLVSHKNGISGQVPVSQDNVNSIPEITKPIEKEEKEKKVTIWDRIERNWVGTLTATTSLASAVLGVSSASGVAASLVGTATAGVASGGLFFAISGAILGAYLIYRGYKTAKNIKRNKQIENQLESSVKAKNLAVKRQKRIKELRKLKEKKESSKSIIDKRKNNGKNPLKERITGSQKASAHFHLTARGFLQDSAETLEGVSVIAGAVVSEAQKRNLQHDPRFKSFLKVQGITATTTESLKKAESFFQAYDQVADAINSPEGTVSLSTLCRVLREAPDHQNSSHPGNLAKRIMNGETNRYYYYLIETTHPDNTDILESSKQVDETLENLTNSLDKLDNCSIEGQLSLDSKDFIFPKEDNRDTYLVLHDIKNNEPNVSQQMYHIVNSLATLEASVANGYKLTKEQKEKMEKLKQNLEIVYNKVESVNINASLEKFNAKEKLFSRVTQNEGPNDTVTYDFSGMITPDDLSKDNIVETLSIFKSDIRQKILRQTLNKLLESDKNLLFELNLHFTNYYKETIDSLCTQKEDEIFTFLSEKFPNGKVLKENINQILNTYNHSAIDTAGKGFYDFYNDERSNYQAKDFKMSAMQMEATNLKKAKQQFKKAVSLSAQSLLHSIDSETQMTLANPSANWGEESTREIQRSLSNRLKNFKDVKELLTNIEKMDFTSEDFQNTIHDLQEASNFIFKLTGLDNDPRIKAFQDHQKQISELLPVLMPAALFTSEIYRELQSIAPTLDFSKQKDLKEKLNFLMENLQNMDESKIERLKDIKYRIDKFSKEDSSKIQTALKDLSETNKYAKSLESVFKASTESLQTFSEELLSPLATTAERMPDIISIANKLNQRKERLIKLGKKTDFLLREGFNTSNFLKNINPESIGLAYELIEEMQQMSKDLDELMKIAESSESKSIKKVVQYYKEQRRIINDNINALVQATAPYKKILQHMSNVSKIILDMKAILPPGAKADTLEDILKSIKDSNVELFRELNSNLSEELNIINIEIQSLTKESKTPKIKIFAEKFNKVNEFQKKATKEINKHAYTAQKVSGHLLEILELLGKLKIEANIDFSEMHLLEKLSSPSGLSFDDIRLIFGNVNFGNLPNILTTLSLLIEKINIDLPEISDKKLAGKLASLHKNLNALRIDLSESSEFLKKLDGINIQLKNLLQNFSFGEHNISLNNIFQLNIGDILGKLDFSNLNGLEFDLTNLLNSINELKEKLKSSQNPSGLIVNGIKVSAEESHRFLSNLAKKIKDINLKLPELKPISLNLRNINLSLGKLNMLSFKPKISLNDLLHLSATGLTNLLANLPYDEVKKAIEFINEIHRKIKNAIPDIQKVAFDQDINIPELKSGLNITLNLLKGIDTTIDSALPSLSSLNSLLSDLSSLRFEINRLKIEISDFYFDISGIRINNIEDLLSLLNPKNLSQLSLSLNLEDLNKLKDLISKLKIRTTLLQKRTHEKLEKLNTKDKNLSNLSFNLLNHINGITLGSINLLSNMELNIDEFHKFLSKHNINLSKYYKRLQKLSLNKDTSFLEQLLKMDLKNPLTLFNNFNIGDIPEILKILNQLSLDIDKLPKGKFKELSAISANLNTIITNINLKISSSKELFHTLGNIQLDLKVSFEGLSKLFNPSMPNFEIFYKKFLSFNVSPEEILSYINLENLEEAKQILISIKEKSEKYEELLTPHKEDSNLGTIVQHSISGLKFTAETCAVAIKNIERIQTTHEQLSSLHQDFKNLKATLNKAANTPIVDVSEISLDNFKPEALYSTLGTLNFDESTALLSELKENFENIKTHSSELLENEGNLVPDTVRSIAKSMQTKAAPIEELLQVAQDGFNNSKDLFNTVHDSYKEFYAIISPLEKILQRNGIQFEKHDIFKILNRENFQDLILSLDSNDFAEVKLLIEQLKLKVPEIASELNAKKYENTTVEEIKKSLVKQMNTASDIAKRLPKTEFLYFSKIIGSPEVIKSKGNIVEIINKLKALSKDPNINILSKLKDMDVYNFDELINDFPIESLSEVSFLIKELIINNNEILKVAKENISSTTTSILTSRLESLQFNLNYFADKVDGHLQLVAENKEVYLAISEEMKKIQSLIERVSSLSSKKTSNRTLDLAGLKELISSIDFEDIQDLSQILKDFSEIIKKSIPILEKLPDNGILKSKIIELKSLSNYIDVQQQKYTNFVEGNKEDWDKFNEAYRELKVQMQKMKLPDLSMSSISELIAENPELYKEDLKAALDNFMQKTENLFDHASPEFKNQFSRVKQNYNKILEQVSSLEVTTNNMRQVNVNYKIGKEKLMQAQSMLVNQDMDINSLLQALQKNNLRALILMISNIHPDKISDFIGLIEESQHYFNEAIKHAKYLSTSNFHANEILKKIDYLANIQIPEINKEELPKTITLYKKLMNAFLEIESIALKHTHSAHNLYQKILTGKINIDEFLINLGSDDLRRVSEILNKEISNDNFDYLPDIVKSFIHKAKDFNQSFYNSEYYKFYKVLQEALSHFTDYDSEATRQIVEAVLKGNPNLLAEKLLELDISPEDVISSLAAVEKYEKVEEKNVFDRRLNQTIDTVKKQVKVVKAFVNDNKQNFEDVRNLRKFMIKRKHILQKLSENLNIDFFQIASYLSSINSKNLQDLLKEIPLQNLPEINSLLKQLNENINEIDKLIKNPEIQIPKTITSSINQVNGAIKYLDNNLSPLIHEGERILLFLHNEHKYMQNLFAEFQDLRLNKEPSIQQFIKHMHNCDISELLKDIDASNKEKALSILTEVAKRAKNATDEINNYPLKSKSGLMFQESAVHTLSSISSNSEIILDNLQKYNAKVRKFKSLELELVKIFHNVAPENINIQNLSDIVNLISRPEKLFSINSGDIEMLLKRLGEFSEQSPSDSSIENQALKIAKNALQRLKYLQEGKEKTKDIEILWSNFQDLLPGDELSNIFDLNFNDLLESISHLEPENLQKGIQLLNNIAKELQSLNISNLPPLFQAIAINQRKLLHSLDLDNLNYSDFKKLLAIQKDINQDFADLKLRVKEIYKKDILSIDEMLKQLNTSPNDFLSEIFLSDMDELRNIFFAMNEYNQKAEKKIAELQKEGLSSHRVISASINRFQDYHHLISSSIKQPLETLNEYELFLNNSDTLKRNIQQFYKQRAEIMERLKEHFNGTQDDLDYLIGNIGNKREVEPLLSLFKEESMSEVNTILSEISNNCKELTGSLQQPYDNIPPQVQRLLNYRAEYLKNFSKKLDSVVQNNQRYIDNSTLKQANMIKEINDALGLSLNKITKLNLYEIIHSLESVSPETLLDIQEKLSELAKTEINDMNKYIILGAQKINKITLLLEKNGIHEILFSLNEVKQKLNIDSMQDLDYENLINNLDNFSPENLNELFSKLENLQQKITNMKDSALKQELKSKFSKINKIIEKKAELNNIIAKSANNALGNLIPQIKQEFLKALLEINRKIFKTDSVKIAINKTSALGKINSLNKKELEGLKEQIATFRKNIKEHIQSLEKNQQENNLSKEDEVLLNHFINTLKKADSDIGVIEKTIDHKLILKNPSHSLTTKFDTERAQKKADERQKLQNKSQLKSNLQAIAPPNKRKYHN